MGRKKYTQYDKLVNSDSVVAVTTVPLKWRTYKKIDADSVPAATLKGIQMSFMDNTSQDDNVSYMVYACLDDGGAFERERIIAHAAIGGGGGGNCYLRINRKIWRSDSGEVGGPITVWIECSDNLDSTTVTSTAYTLRCRVTT